ncbi:MAG: hypothetical protein PWP38_1621, partial [Clostridiales bacterium]|nr:hypothetical protein [Clostridiales bacterium]
DEGDEGDEDDEDDKDLTASFGHHPRALCIDIQGILVSAG